jgi:hypothetical protein
MSERVTDLTKEELACANSAAERYLPDADLRLCCRLLSEHRERGEMLEAVRAVRAQFKHRDGGGQPWVAALLDKALTPPHRLPGTPSFICGACRDTGKWSNGIDCPVCKAHRLPGREQG